METRGEKTNKPREGHFASGYLKIIRERKEKSRVYKSYQALGLELALILDDPGHKAFYMKLAKTRSADELMRLAKDVASRPNVKNKGAYFMRLLHSKD